MREQGSVSRSQEEAPPLETYLLNPVPTRAQQTYRDKG